MRILVINPPLVRLNSLGACEQDRLANLDDLKRLGHDVQLFTAVMKHHSPEQITAFYAARAIPVTAYYKPIRKWLPERFSRLAYVDGASWENGETEMLAALDRYLTDHPVDLVWCHATYVWAPAIVARKHGLPTVIRSVNYEADHLLQEDGHTLMNYIRYVGKSAAERTSLRSAAVLAAITPAEAAIYRRINPQVDVQLLPLRSLPRLMRKAPHQQPPVTDKIRVFFMGSSFSVPHNLAALKFVVDEVVPKVRQLAPHTFEFHMLGSKLPAAWTQWQADDLIFDHFVEDLDAHLATMHIALMPSVFGAGMQQKVFEPLCRGFPEVTHQRALAGYEFRAGEEVMTADNAESFAQQLISLREPARRQQVGAAARAQAEKLFSQASMDARVESILSAAMRQTTKP